MTRILLEKLIHFRINLRFLRQIKKMIHIINEQKREITTIKKIDENTWEFTLIPRGLGSTHDKEYELKEKILLGREGLEDIISALKNFIKNKPTKAKPSSVRWKSNSANITLECRFRDAPSGQIFYVSYYYDNKALKFYERDLIELAEGIDIYETGRQGIMISTTKKNIKKYIRDLERELGIVDSDSDDGEEEEEKKKGFWWRFFSLISRWFNRSPVSSCGFNRPRLNPLFLKALQTLMKFMNKTIELLKVLIKPIKFISRKNNNKVWC